MPMFHVFNIRWDVDRDSDGASLPTELAVFIADEEAPEEHLADKISDMVGFCHDGFDFTPKPDWTPPHEIPSFTGLRGEAHDEVVATGRDFPCFAFFSRGSSDDAFRVFNGWTPTAYVMLEAEEWEDWINVRARSEEEARANYEAAYDQWRKAENGGEG